MLDRHFLGDVALALLLAIPLAALSRPGLVETTSPSAPAQHSEVTAASRPVSLLR